MAELNPEEQEMMAKHRQTTSETIGVGGTQEAPPPSVETMPSGMVEGQDVWGPYPDKLYAKQDVHVTVPWGGTFGVPKGKQLYFETKEYFSRRENRNKTGQFPMYRSREEVEKIKAGELEPQPAA